MVSITCTSPEINTVLLPLIQLCSFKSSIIFPTLNSMFGISLNMSNVQVIISLPFSFLFSNTIFKNFSLSLRNPTLSPTIVLFFISCSNSFCNFLIPFLFSFTDIDIMKTPLYLSDFISTWC